MDIQLKEIQQNFNLGEGTSLLSFAKERKR